MVKKKFADKQPENFSFSEQSIASSKKILASYPAAKKQSAIIPLLWLAQDDNGGWLSHRAIEAVASLVEAPIIRVYEVVTFYSMFNTSPVGRYFIQVCGTTPCMVCGAGALIEVCEELIGKSGVVTEDGLFSWTEVECLGACVNAPLVQINKDNYEDLDADKLRNIIKSLKSGESVAPGSQIDRAYSAPKGGRTSLLDGD